MNESIIEKALTLAFEAGKWAGQVELEEHFDNEQFATSALESVYARKNSMPLHESSLGRTVTINLRSKEWRAGVKSSSKEYLEKAKRLILENANKNRQLELQF